MRYLGVTFTRCRSCLIWNFRFSATNVKFAKFVVKRYSKMNKKLRRKLLKLMILRAFVSLHLPHI